MQYKTIILHLLEQFPEMRNRLQGQRKLLQTLNAYANELKRRHEAWKDVLSQPEWRSQSQFASQALEFALEDVVNEMRSEASPEESLGPSLDEAMAFIRRQTPHS